MHARIVVLVLSLVMAVLPSWAAACAASASSSPCQHDMSGTGQGGMDANCDEGKMTGGQHGPMSSSCPMSALCGFATAAPLYDALFTDAVAVSSIIVIPIPEHYASADVSQLFRPPIA